MYKSQMTKCHEWWLLRCFTSIAKHCSRTIIESWWFNTGEPSISATYKHFEVLFVPAATLNPAWRSFWTMRAPSWPSAPVALIFSSSLPNATLSYQWASHDFFKRWHKRTSLVEHMKSIAFTKLQLDSFSLEHMCNGFQFCSQIQAPASIAVMVWRLSAKFASWTVFQQKNMRKLDHSSCSAPLCTTCNVLELQTGKALKWPVWNINTADHVETLTTTDSTYWSLVPVFLITRLHDLLSIQSTWARKLVNVNLDHTL